MDKMAELQDEIMLTSEPCGTWLKAFRSTHGMFESSHDHIRYSRRHLPLVKNAAAVPEALSGSVMLLGNFDGFHRGHQALLKAAVEQAGNRPVGIMSVEPHPRQLFSPQSGEFRLTTPASKSETFSRFGMSFLYSPCFDRSFAGQEPEQFVDDILVGGFSVSQLVVGRGFRFGMRRRGDVDLLRRMGQESGFGVTAVDEVQCDDVTCSSTLVRELLLAGDIQAANAMLGYSWSVQLDVPLEASARSGEWTVGWPDGVLMPQHGNYEVAVRRAGETEPMLFGRIAFDSPRSVRLALDSPLHSAAAAPQAALFVDFLARSRSV